MPAEAGATTVTIIVAPGERFSLAPRSLRSPGGPHRAPLPAGLCDAGSPVAVRNEIAALAAVHGFTVIRNERPLPPNQARNLGLAATIGRRRRVHRHDLLFHAGLAAAAARRPRARPARLVSPII